MNLAVLCDGGCGRSLALPPCPTQEAGRAVAIERGWTVRGTPPDQFFCPLCAEWKVKPPPRDRLYTAAELNQEDSGGEFWQKQIAVQLAGIGERLAELQALLVLLVNHQVGKHD